METLLSPLVMTSQDDTQFRRMPVKDTEGRNRDQLPPAAGTAVTLTAGTPRY